MHSCTALLLGIGHVFRFQCRFHSLRTAMLMDDYDRLSSLQFSPTSPVGYIFGSLLVVFSSLFFAQQVCPAPKMGNVILNIVMRIFYDFSLLLEKVSTVVITFFFEKVGHRDVLCSWRALSHDLLVWAFGVDAAKNEPSSVWRGVTLGVRGERAESHISLLLFSAFLASKGVSFCTVKHRRSGMA